MTLDEAIKHCEEIAEEKKKKACNLYDAKNYEESRECIWCAKEHRQLAEWLKELKQLKEQEPCEDCISREQMMNSLDEVGGDFDKPREAVVPLDYVADMVADLPSVRPKEEVGHWQKISADKYSEHAAYYFRCSECGKDIIGEHNYCPNCGCRTTEGSE